jgi:hypothetical protein
MARRPRILLRSRQAKLATDQFARDYLVRLFGQPALDSLPTLERGPNKGQPKGWLIWRTAMSAGWVAECQGPCAEGGLVDAWVGAHQFTDRNDAMLGQWCGRGG